MLYVNYISIKLEKNTQTTSEGAMQMENKHTKRHSTSHPGGNAKW